MPDCARSREALAVGHKSGRLAPFLQPQLAPFSHPASPPPLAPKSSAVATPTSWRMLIRVPLTLSSSHASPGVEHHENNSNKSTSSCCSLISRANANEPNCNDRWPAGQTDSQPATCSLTTSMLTCQRERQTTLVGAPKELAGNKISLRLSSCWCWCWCSCLCDSTGAN